MTQDHRRDSGRGAGGRGAAGRPAHDARIHGDGPDDAAPWKPASYGRSGFLTDQCGVALPMSMLTLLILSALVLGFSGLAATEPTIASNQLMVAQARSLAEAGLEHAIWALNNPANSKGLPGTGTVPAPYDGSRLVLVAVNGHDVGGFRVTVTNGASAGERVMTAVGWGPNDAATTPKAHQKITLAMTNPQLLFKDPPAALSVRGELQAGGNALVDSRSDTSCGKKVGTLTTGATSLPGNAADIRGAADDNNTRNEVTDANNGPLPANAHDIVLNLATSSFDQFVLTDGDINSLRAYANAHGTYRQGIVDFNVSNTMPNGRIFVDTVTGNNITPAGVSPATPPSDLANVSIHGGAAADPSGIYSGWLFVNGSLSISGTFTMHGMLYTQNELSYHGTGDGGVSGAVISRNIQDTAPTSIDSDLLGKVNITYNCAHAKTGDGTIPFQWSVRGGTYREPCDSCS